MKLLFTVGIIAIACVLPAFANVIPDNASKVKIIDARIVKLDDEYVNSKTYKLEVIPVNKTYNSLLADYEIVKDIPAESSFEVEVLRSESLTGPYKKIRNVVIPKFCTNIKDKNFKLLPELIVRLNGEGKCYPKNHYSNPNATYFKFYDLLTDAELTKAYFKVTSSLVLNGKVIYALQLDYQSNQ